jgi:diguanylate cyclase (GGDEF)-like protein
MEGRSFEDIDLKIMKLIAHKVATVIDNICVLTELNLLTTTDPMTNVYNYRKFLNGLDHEIQRFNREKMKLYVFMIDIDDFKSYNDTFGHPEGDELLRGVGEILKKNLRATDLVCRYAGDEFCLVVSDLAQDDVQKVAQKIISAVEAFPFKRKVTVSIGIAMFEEGLSKKDFIKKADTALYQAKHSGKNQAVIS